MGRLRGTFRPPSVSHRLQNKNKPIRVMRGRSWWLAVLQPECVCASGDSCFTRVHVQEKRP